MSETFNRTSMELKRASQRAASAAKSTFNRTSMELKLSKTSCNPAVYVLTFNRTSMELKPFLVNRGQVKGGF